MNFLDFLNFKQCNEVLINYNKLLNLVASNLHCSVAQKHPSLVDVDCYNQSLLVTVPELYVESSNFSNADFVTLHNSFLQLDRTFLRMFLLSIL